MAVPAQVADHFTDQHWRLNNLYWITDKEGDRVRFELNWAQADLLEELHFLNVVLKARQLGFCLDPKTRVLTADLEWVAIEDLRPGQSVVAVDEFGAGGKGKLRKMRTATVQGKVEVGRTAYRVSFDDGRSVVCTGKHPWLSKKAGSTATWRSIEADTKKKLRVGTKVRWITKPWDASTFEDGWFGGMLDGEGSMKKTNTAAGVCVAQRPGPVWDRMVAYCKARGYAPRVESDAAERLTKLGKVPVPKLMFGRLDEIFRLIGQTRPTRFLGNRFWEGRELPGKSNGEVGWASITAIEPLGEQTMIDLQTSTGTYIAEGFVSHNTTFIQLYMLDICVFHPDTRAGVIAHTKDDAEAIFRDKIKFPYDHLPDAIKRANPVLRDNTTTLELGNNSIIRVGTSLRGGTLQYLHVSEFGRICAKYPEKAREIVTGALNTIEAGQVAFIESTAEGQEGRFYELCQMAQSQQRMGAGLTPLDWKFHFYPWWREPSYEIDPQGVIISPELEKYFRKIEPFVKAAGYELTARKRAWYAKKLEMQREDMKREFPSTADEAFEAAVEGAYYADQIAVAELQGRIGEFPAVPGVLVHTVQDIGVGDDTTIWFFQIFPRKVRLVGCYSNNGEGMPHYVAKIRQMALAKGWRLGKHWLPHDGKVREWGTGLTRAEQFVKELQPVKIVPDHYLDDGINAAREVFGICEFDAEACSEGLRALRNYRKEWDEERAIWKDRPRHDWASHYGDGFRYLAMAYREEIPPPEPAKVVEPKGVADMTFNQLLKAQRPKRERI